jgi:hypothetical protein
MAAITFLMGKYPSPLLLFGKCQTAGSSNNTYHSHEGQLTEHFMSEGLLSAVHTPRSVFIFTIPFPKNDLN